VPTPLVFNALTAAAMLAKLPGMVLVPVRGWAKVIVPKSSAVTSTKYLRVANDDIFFIIKY
jgi:hypothetical protein